MANKVKRLPTVIPTLPLAAERMYRRELVSIWSFSGKVIMNVLTPVFEAWLDERNDDVLSEIIKVLGTDVMDLNRRYGIEPLPSPHQMSASWIERLSPWTKRLIDFVLSLTNRIDRSVNKSLDSAKSHEHRTTNRILKVNTKKEIPGIGAVGLQWTQNNVEIIRNALIGTRTNNRQRHSLVDSVISTVSEAFREKAPLKSAISKVRGVIKRGLNRARNIATNEILTLNSSLTGHRQKSVGITEYIWITMDDDRVRPFHIRLHRTKQRWDSPPEVAPGVHAHPGEDYNCRCRSVPVPLDWMEA